MNFVFYDLETTGRNTTWDQIIQVGAILLDENFRELERLEERCSLRPGLVPEPGALIVNNTSISRQDVVSFFIENPDSFPKQDPVVDFSLIRLKLYFLLEYIFLI